MTLNETSTAVVCEYGLWIAFLGDLVGHVYDLLFHGTEAKDHHGSVKVLKQENHTMVFYTSGFWPRVRARALRAPVFLGALPRPTGHCEPPPPIAASLLP